MFRVFCFFGNNEFLFQRECKENYLLDVICEQMDKIGDGKFLFCFFIILGNVQDFYIIIFQILLDFLQGVYNDIVQLFCIIDCRYLYEYMGGYIKVF